jgi:tape measure domain-containing protein
MADKISVSYDANIDDMKRKLDELIAKNKELSAYATAAAKALSNIASAQGLSTINNINNSFNTTVNVLAQVNTNLTQVNAQLNNTTNSFNRMGQQVNSVKQSITVFDSLLKRVAARVAAYFAIDSVVGFAKSIVDVERKMEILQNRINFVFDSATGGTLAFNRLREMSIRLGIEFTSLAEGFASFGIAAKMAGFSASESESMFGKVAVALRASGASSLQTQRSFYALQQMLSKGVVAAEELRRQLGEALPGASDLMTKAYNRLHPAQEITNRQFTKLLEDGKIISAEILPEFANVVEEVFAPALSGKQNSLDASINRVTTQLDRFKLALANFLPTKAVANTLSDFFGSLNTMMEAGFKDFVRLGALAASGNFAAFDSELAKLEIVRAAETAKAEREQKDIENRIKQRAELYAKQGVSTEKAISGETDRITEQRKELEELNKELERREIALKKARTANVGQPGTAGMSGMADVVGAKEALKQQKELVKQKEKEIEFTQGLITAIGQLSQKREEEQEKVSADTKKAEIAAAKELLAAEETRLVATTEGTTAYYNQLIKVIEARKNLAKIEQRDTPQAMGLSLAKLDKDLEKATKMIGSFDPNAPDFTEEVAVSFEAYEKLSKDIKDLTAQRLEDVVAGIETEIQFHEEGTDRRLELEKALVMAKARLAAKNAEIQGKSVKEIEAIFAKANIEMQKLDTDFNDGKKKEAEDYAEFYKRLQDGLDGYEGNSLDKRLKAIRKYYGELIAEAKVYGRTKEEIDALAKNRDQALFEENVKEVGKFVNAAGDLYGQFTQLQEMEFNNQKTALDNKLAQGLISEEQYNAELADIEKKQFEQNKKTQKVNVLINSASAIVRAFSELGPIGGALAAFAIGAMAIKQMSLIDSAQFPEGFKEGVIDLNGPGTGTSDSIPARLSRGESVMTADETKRYKPVLQAIRDNNFEEFVSKRYIDAMSGTKRSFADNVGASLELNNFEMIDAIRKNKSVKIANWDDFDKVLRKPRTAHKVHRRRAW